MVSGVDLVGEQREYGGVEGLSRRLMASSVEGCLGMRVLELDDAVVRAGMPIPRGPLAGDGVGLAAALSVLVDTAGGLAIALHRRAGLSGPTIELRMNYAAPPAPGATMLIAEASVRYEVGEAGYAEALVYDDTGRELGRACGHYLLPEPDSEPDGSFVDNDEAAGSLGRPDAMLAALTPAGADRAGADRAGVDRAGVDRAGVDTGGLDAGGGDAADWSLPTPLVFANPRAQVHGGLLMTIGELGQRRTQAADLAEPALLRPLSVQIDFQRPVPVDGGALRCRTGYVRRGRRFRTLCSQLFLADGRVAAVVTGLWSVAGSR